MSWEAFRWTAKSPSELYHVLGPHGVDDLVRQMIAAVWRDMPAEERTFEGAVRAARQVYDRNIAVWRRRRLERGIVVFRRRDRRIIGRPRRKGKRYENRPGLARPVH